MIPEDIQNNLKKLEKSMYGHNYQVTFGLNVFDNCFNIDYASKKIEEAYEDIKAEKVTPALVDKDDFWREVNYGLSYRGDYGAGLSLTKDKEKELEKEQAKYKDFISQFINHKTQFYSYPYLEGVFWDYNFLLITGDKGLFVFGAASD